MHRIPLCFSACGSRTLYAFRHQKQTAEAVKCAAGFCSLASTTPWSEETSESFQREGSHLLTWTGWNNFYVLVRFFNITVLLFKGFPFTCKYIDMYLHCIKSFKCHISYIESSSSSSSSHSSSSSSSSSIGTTTPCWGLVCSTIFEPSQQEGFYRVLLPAARQTPNLEDQWLERSNSRHKAPPASETTQANPGSGRCNYGREMAENFAESGDFHVTFGFFYML